MKRIIMFNIFLMMAVITHASAPVSPVSPLKQWMRFFRIGQNSWQEDLMMYLQKNSINSVKGIEYTQPDENTMKITGTFRVNPVTYAVVKDQNQALWKFEIIINRSNPAIDIVEFVCPKVAYFKTINKIDYEQGSIEFSKLQEDDLFLEVDFLMRILNPYGGIYTE